MLVDGHLVDVEIAGNLRVAWDEKPVKILICALAPPENVFEPPDGFDRSHIHAIGLADQTHRADEVPLMDRDLLVGQSANEKKLTGLIGSKREAHVIHHEPIGKTARALDFGRLNLLRLDIGRTRSRGLCSRPFRCGSDLRRSPRIVLNNEAWTLFGCWFVGQLFRTYAIVFVHNNNALSIGQQKGEIARLSTSPPILL